MITLALVVLPLVASLAMIPRGARPRGADVMILVAFVTSLLTFAEVGLHSTWTPLPDYVHVDSTSHLFLALINPIFLGVAVYVRSRVMAAPELKAGMGRFAGLSLAFLGASNAVMVANHFIVLWVALETTTLVIAPLIIRRGSTSSRLASWRYLLFSTVGLALALLGFLCFARGIDEGGGSPTFMLDRLEQVAAASANRWGYLGVALVILGIGTKLGLAPMYSWLPEAYDEAPPPVTALLGAVQFNAALVVLLRVVHVVRPVHGDLVTSELVTLGLVSMVVSTFSIIATRNMKRLIAYASINHAGVIAIGLGLGRTASYGLLLYVLSNAFIKAILFLTAGKIKAQYGTEDTREISGLLKDMPFSGVFLMVGTFALLGFPPFGSFFGELLILSALVRSGHVFVFGAFSILITMTFVATGRTIFPMIWGEPKLGGLGSQQTLASVWPKMIFFLLLVVLGLYIPPVANTLIQQVAASVGGS